MEALVAFAIAMVALLGLAQVTNKSVGNSGLSKRQSEATAYASRVVEYLRDQKNTQGWSGLKSSYSGSNYCYDGSTLNALASCVITGTEFTSTVTVAYVTPTPPGPAGSEIMKISSNVSWVEGGLTHFAKQSAELVKY